MELSIPCKMLPDEYLILSQACSNASPDKRAGLLQQATGGKPIVVEYEPRRAAAFEQQHPGFQTSQTVGQGGVSGNFTAKRLLPATIIGDLKVPPSVEKLDNISVRGNTTAEYGALREVGSRFNTRGNFDAYECQTMSKFAGTVGGNTLIDRCQNMRNFEGRTNGLEIGRDTPMQRIDGAVNGRIITMDGNVQQQRGGNSQQQSPNLSPVAAIISGVIGSSGQNIPQTVRNIAQQTYNAQNNGQGYNGQGHNGQGYNGQSHNGQGHNGQGYNGQGHNGQGHNGQSHNGQGYNGQGYNGQGYNGRNNGQNGNNAAASIEDIALVARSVLGVINSSGVGSRFR